MPIEAAPLVAYRSRGRLLIIGDADQALTLSAGLQCQGLECYVLARGEGMAQAAGDVPLLSSTGVTISISPVIWGHSS